MIFHDTCSKLHNYVTINNLFSEDCLNIVKKLSTSISASDSKPEVGKNVNELISFVLDDDFEQ